MIAAFWGNFLVFNKLAVFFLWGNDIDAVGVGVSNIYPSGFTIFISTKELIVHMV